MGVSKTDFMRGMQCPKMLWLDKNKRQERIIPPEVQAKLDQGNDFGDSAMSIFGDFVETTSYKPDGTLDYKAMLQKTKDCLDTGVGVICEAAFSVYGNYCAVDILKKVGGRYEIYEVKNSPQVEEQFIKDLAFQRYILLCSGVRISKCFVIYSPKTDEKYAIEEVTDRVKSYSEWVKENIWKLSKIKSQPTEPQIAMGEQCQTPYECWYCEYCKREKNENKGSATSPV